MNLEQIDTSTTAGKAEVMRLAAEGRRVSCRRVSPVDCWRSAGSAPGWDWSTFDYAIIAEPVGPGEVWVVLNGCGQVCAITEYEPIHLNTTAKVRYVRADLTGEVK